MKKTFIIMATVAVALAFTGCRSKKNLAVTPQEQGKIEIALPCVEESYDDENYFRAMGTATNENMQNARTSAIEAAQSMLRRRLGGFAKGLSTDYSRTIAADAQVEKIQRAMEAEITTVIEKMINDADKTCEKMLQNQAGNYESYIAIRVSKKELIKETQSKVSGMQELEVEYNREKFREFAEKRLKEMEASQQR